MINSSQKVVFHVFSRDSVGSKSARKLRKQGKSIGNIFGLSMDSMGIFMDSHAVKKLYEKIGDTSLIYLQVGDEKKQIPVLIDAYEQDILLHTPLHVSFRRVNLLDPIEADVSVSLVGESKISDAVVTLVKDTITVKALPADLPEHFEINISGLTEVGQTITLNDIPTDPKVTFVLDEGETPEDILLVTVQEVKEEVEKEPEEIETEIIGKSGNGDKQAAEDSEKTKEVVE